MLRNKAHNTDPLWHVQLILLGAIGVQLLLPDAGLPLPRYGLITLELLLMLTLQIVTPKKAVFSSALRRFVVILLIALIALTNVAALQHLVSSLLNNGHIAPQNLLISALNVYLTTSVIFALLYWEMDGGGPGQRRVSDLAIRDFLFPQQNI